MASDSLLDVIAGLVKRDGETKKEEKKLAKEKMKAEKVKVEKLKAEPKMKELYFPDKEADEIKEYLKNSTSKRKKSYKRKMSWFLIFFLLLYYIIKLGEIYEWIIK